MPENATYVGRPTKFGNELRVGKDGTAQECVDGYRKKIDGNMWTYPTKDDIKKELRGKDLACFCPLSQPCHESVLLEIANSETRHGEAGLGRAG